MLNWKVYLRNVYMNIFTKYVQLRLKMYKLAKCEKAVVK